MVYLVSSKKEEIRKKLVKKICVENKIDIENLETFNFDGNINSFINFCNSKSFFNSKRIILVKNSFILDKISNLTKENWNLLINFLQLFNKQNNDHIIFLSESKINNNDPIIKSIMNQISIREMDDYTKKELEKIITDFLSKRNLNFNPSDVIFLLKRIDYDLLRLENELKKIGLLNLDLNKNLIEKIIPNNSFNRIWSLLNYLFNNETENFILIYNNLKKEGYNEIFLLNLIVNELFHLKNIFLLKEYNFNNDEIISKLKLNKFKFMNLNQKLSNLSKKNVENLILLVEKINYKIKFNNGNQKIEFLKILLN